ncbi:MAG: carboxy terminal-processing peptidase, partial [Bacteroidota bacterium]|nr:carboxy terminal-processing peptidase [Bacteroidota bacterium]
SASEIFAAAIQDYGRGIVIGSTSTFGKGTVQRSIGLDPESNFMSSSSDLGSLKLTLQKFYRINGGSTQLRGVTPDIVIPDQFEYLKFRERDNENAMPWDEVNKASFKIWNGGYDIQSVKNITNAKIQTSPLFLKIKENTAKLTKRNDRQYTLQIDKFRKEQSEMRATVKELETLLKLEKEMSIAYLPEDAKRHALDENKQERYNLWLKNLSKDIYLDQAVKVIDEIKNQQNLARAKQKNGIKSF